MERGEGRGRRGTTKGKSEATAEATHFDCCRCRHCCCHRAVAVCGGVRVVVVHVSLFIPVHDRHPVVVGIGRCAMTRIPVRFREGGDRERNVIHTGRPDERARVSKTKRREISIPALSPPVAIFVSSSKARGGHFPPS